MIRLIKYLYRNVKLAFKSVIFHFKQYLVFFIALLIIQTFYGIITMASDNNNDIEFNMINEEYDYHFILKDLNIDQYIFMMEDKYTVFRTDHIHDVVRTQERRTPDLEGSKYDIYIRLRGENIKEVYEKRFKLRYDQELASLNPAGFTRSTSPLMTFDQNLLANTIVYILFSILLTVISVFLLMMLYFVQQRDLPNGDRLRMRSFTSM